MPIAEIAGGALHYDIAGPGLNASPEGSAPLVLLLPQSTGPVGLKGLINGLAQQRTVITYDQRGTGSSSPAPDNQSMATQSEDLIGLLDALDLESASLLCHSTGCGIGLTMVAHIPDRISSLVLAAPWTHADPHLSTMQNLRIAAARALEPEQYAHFNAALLYPPDYRRTHQGGFAQLARDAIAKPQDADQIARRLHAILALDVRPLLADIKVRTLVMTAKDDQLMPSWFAAKAADALPNGQLVELEGGGHMLLETRTTEIVDNTLAFLQS